MQQSKAQDPMQKVKLILIIKLAKWQWLCFHGLWLFLRTMNYGHRRSWSLEK